MRSDTPSADTEDRRNFLRSMTTAGVAGLILSQGSVAAQAQPTAAPKAAPLGKLGAASAGTGRPKIAMLVHPNMVMQDLIGPLTVFNLMRSEIHLVWKNTDPVMTELGLPVAPTTRFADCPKDLDILFAPGGLDGTIAVMDDPEVVEFFADRGSRARYVCSDCTGSLLLGAAGLLRGYKATSNWTTRDLLSLFGATPVHERVVHDRNRITAGGVTAGIDFGLTLAALIRGDEAAQRIQLVIEYAPAPPFNSGTPETAPPAIRDQVTTARAEAVESARQKALKIAAQTGH